MAVPRRKWAAAAQLASLWLPALMAMALVYYGSSRPDGARKMTQPIKAAIVRVLGGGPHAGA
ncbi:MAG: hypothetical protein ACM3ZA_02080 [Bacillota bacterium]